MNTVFVGGSRHVSRLPAQVKERLNNIIHNGHRVVVGDANGADKAVQRYFLDASYKDVTVFCSGDKPRNNLGFWEVQHITPPKGVKGFQFYAAKDREMAHKADFGLMIWDGKSPGTVLNVMRLVRAGKKAVLMNVPEKKGTTFRSADEWTRFLSACSAELVADLRERALPDEWCATPPSAQRDFFDSDNAERQAAVTEGPVIQEAEMTRTINAALAAGDASTFVDALGNVARAHGMTHVAKEAGLARESLYRSLGSGGNPEFATVIKIMAAVGLRLEATKA
jgi:adenine-specific DNA-methyltransferase